MVEKIAHKNPRVAVAMSGGVDSSVALLLLKNAGYNVVGFTAKLLGDDTEGSCCSILAAYNARRVCDTLGVPHYMINLKEPFFEKVIKRFATEYSSGRTPNPCVDCNRFIKFKHFLQIADSMDCQFLTTGHYARIVDANNFQKSLPNSPKSDWLNLKSRFDNGANLRLLRGIDRNKDQSYFVAMITTEEMKRVLFPCGEYLKEQVRAIAQEANLPTAKMPDSQDVCFLHSGHDITYWLRTALGKEPSPGIIKDISGAELGEHKGIEYFTRGQRKGLRISGGPPRYVVDIDPTTNSVIVAEQGKKLASAIRLSHVNILVEGFVNSGKPLSVRTRYRQKEVLATIKTTMANSAQSSVNTVNTHLDPPQELFVEFLEPQQFISPGQWCVFCDDETVVGCGLIEETLPS